MRADFQLVCGAGPYEIDVLVRDPEGVPTLEIGGQITWAGSIHDPVEALPLALVREAPAPDVERTWTDEFGEFGFSPDRGNSYGIRLGDESNAPCVLVWDGEAE